MPNLRLSSVFIISISLLLYIVNLNGVDGVCHAYHYHSDDCGVIEEIPGDTRTQIPWTVGIFTRENSNRNYSFHATGTIIGPTTIITVFTGALEKLPRKIWGKFSPQVLDNFLVVGGLASGNLYEGDRHKQISQITFIQPYLGQEEPNRDYHFVLIHLKIPFDFSTPYVRPLCLSHFKLGRKSKSGAGAGNETLFLQGGFAKKKLKSATTTGVTTGTREHKGAQSSAAGDSESLWDVELRLQLVSTGTGYECVKTYEKYYNKHFPIGIFCSKVPNTYIHPGLHSLDPSSHLNLNNAPCMFQGSSVIQRIGQQWYLAGLTALVRGRKAGFCRNDTIYFNARLSTAMEWLDHSLRCSPFSFPCTDGTCISAESVCNSVRNCLDDGIDENDILCESNKKCESLGNSADVHQCNLVGGCISKSQLCDGTRDCHEGSDESSALCNIGTQSSRSSRDLSPNSVIQYCLPLVESEGVHVEYISLNHDGLANCTFIPVSTFALSKCKNFYKSKNLHTRLEQQCMDNGKWSEQLKFECESDCGMVNEKLILNTSPMIMGEFTLPWHALLFNLDQSSQKVEFICGATLIERQYLLSAGHCFSASVSLKSYKVVLSAVSKNFSDNLRHERPVIAEIENVWRPEDFNMTTKESDIAIFKLKRPVDFGAQLRPACYNRHDEIESSPKPKSGDLQTIAIAGLHSFNFPEIADMACIPKDFTGQKLGFRCVGHQNGTSVKQLDTGGGLVSPMKTKFGSRYVLKGVMSFEESFGYETISQFTAVERYQLWISNIIQR